MKTIEISKASKSLSDYAKELNNEILVITSDNEPIAAVVSLKNVDMESLSLSTNPEFMEIIEKSRRDFKLGKKVSLDEIKREISSMD